MTDATADYYRGLGDYFGAEVEHLEELDAGNPVHRYLRQHSLATLELVFSAPGPLLEIGYGTGVEAAHLASRGFRILGIDPSAAMQAAAQARAARAGVSERTEFRVGSTADLPALADEFGDGHFAGSYATLGPMNCEPDLTGVARALGRALRPGAPFVTMVVNRYCVWEWALYLSRGRFKKAFRRQVRGWADLQGGPGGPSIPVFTYTPRAFARAFEGPFETERVFALPIALPPPYAAAKFAAVPRLLALLESADLKLRDSRLAANLGDHFEIVLRRRP